MSIPMAPSSEIFIDDILKKSLIFKEKRLDLIGRVIMTHNNASKSLELQNRELVALKAVIGIA